MEKHRGQRRQVAIPITKLGLTAAVLEPAIDEAGVEITLPEVFVVQYLEEE
jgi:hypothetical protein